MFLYRFVRRRTGTTAAADSCSRDNFWTTLGISFIFLYNCRPWPIEYLIRFWSILVVTLILNFQGQIWNLLYLSQKWSDCHETKGKHIDWNLGLKCDQRVWPWPWFWPWIFKVNYWICYISTKSGPTATKQKANISIELQVSNVSNGLDVGHDLDIWIFKANVTFAIWWSRSCVMIFQVVTGVTSDVGVSSTHLVGSHKARFLLGADKMTSYNLNLWQPI